MKKRAIEVRVMEANQIRMNGAYNESPESLASSDDWYSTAMCIAVDAIESVEPHVHRWPIAWHEVEVTRNSFCGPCIEKQPCEWDQRTFAEIRTKTGRNFIVIKGPGFEEIAALMRDPS